MKSLVCLLFLIVFFDCCKHETDTSVLPYFNSPDFTPLWLKKTDAQYLKLHTIPAFSFKDQNGMPVTKKNVEGKIYVANFFFTRCNNICPKMMDNMDKIANVFKNDDKVLFLSHTVTPLYDNVGVLKKYADQKQITNPNWHLLTGNKEKIYDIARTGYFADAETKAQLAQSLQFLHTENLILVDKNQHIRGVYNGTITLEAENLISHIKILEQED